MSLKKSSYFCCVGTYFFAGRSQASRRDYDSSIYIRLRHFGLAEAPKYKAVFSTLSVTLFLIKFAPPFVSLRTLYV